MTMRTAHLELKPFSPQHLLALVEGDERFAACFGHRAAPGLRGFFTSDEVSPAWLAQLRESPGADLWVHGLAIVHREDGLVVGTIGFKGPPDDAGMVEIAYGVVPAYQGRGYATEAAQAAIEVALGNADVRLVRAHTLPTPSASTRVLQKCGFERIGEVDDPEDGRVWRWERSAAPG
jgi:RimJ/RimL family protein N-acetyltransferase